MRVSSNELLENYSALADKAVNEPVTITCDGRDQLVLLSIDEYQRLKRRDRRVYPIEEMTDEQLAALEKADVPPEYAYLDDELKDWKPRACRVLDRAWSSGTGICGDASTSGDKRKARTGP